VNLSSITAVTVNFKTPKLIYDCVNSFHAHYPGVQHIIIDNGGCEKSLKLLRKLQGKELLTLLENGENTGHGPALNQGIANVETPYVFLLDSDTKTEHGGFLEKMLELFEQDAKLFACGWLRKVDTKTGVAYRVSKGSPLPNVGLAYIHPYACLMDVEKFRRGRGFANRGAPALEPMLDAFHNGYTVKAFPIEDYIWHKVAGTRGLFGGRFAVKVTEEPGTWKRYNI